MARAQKFEAGQAVFPMLASLAVILLKSSFNKERFDREGTEKGFGFGYVGDPFGAVGGKETGIGILGDADAGDEVTLSKQIDYTMQFFN